MEWVLIIIFIIVFIALPEPVNMYDDTVAKDAIKLNEKRCPPHKWSFVEVKDATGEVVGTKLTCAHCGPLHNKVQE